MTKIYFFLVTLFLSFCGVSQSLLSISPANANSGQTLSVTISGTHTHFIQTSGTTVNFSFAQTSGTVVNSVTVVNDSILSANLTVPVNVPSGSYDVTTTNPTDGTLSLVSSFYVNGITPPSLVAVNPGNGSAGQTLNVTITGTRTHFSQAVTNQVSFSFSQTSGTAIINSVTVANDSSLQANITIPSNIVSGYYNANVQNSIDGFVSLNNGFYVIGIPQPSIALVNPSVAQTGQTLNVTITGSNTHFVQGGSTAVDFTFMQTSGTVVASFVNSINTVSDSLIIANITVPTNAVVGNYKVRVYDVTDGFLFDDFYVFDNYCYSHFSTGYNSGNNQFTLTIDSATVASAIGYHWDFGDGSSSNVQTPSHLFTQDTTYNVCLTIKTSIADSCIYCHVIGKDSSGIVLKQTTSGFSLNVVLNNSTVTGITESGKSGGNLSLVAIPNPATREITISLSSVVELKNALISVYNTSGALIIEEPVLQHHTTLDISNFSDGLYFIKVSTIEGNENLKFLKQ
ncbi:MAG: T9SS type A sorting domain-containing protein [Bacteroidota bacterium]